MMTPTFRLGRVAGIEVGLHWSVLVVMLLFVWNLADAVLPDLAPGEATAVYWLAAGLGVVALFSSLLAHEVAHSVVARRRGVEVDRITLWLLGGVSQLHGEASTPDHELRIAAAGPLTSLGLGAGFGALALVVAAAGGPDLAVVTVGWLGGANLLLALFNLLPGAPLDGGRLLHARVWRRTGDRAAATRAATRAGARIGYTLIGLGVALFLLGDLASLWFVFLGWFLLSASQAEATHALLQGALANVRVRDVMTDHPMTVPVHTSVGTLVNTWFTEHGPSTLPVVDERGSVTGVVTLSKIRSIPLDQRESLDAAAVADPRDTVATGSSDEPVAALLARMWAADGGGGRALVFDHERLVGIVAPRDIQRAIDLAALRDPKTEQLVQTGVRS